MAPLNITPAPDQSTEQNTVERGAEGGADDTPAAGLPEAQIVTPMILSRFIREGSPFVTVRLTPGLEISK